MKSFPDLHHRNHDFTFLQQQQNMPTKSLVTQRECLVAADIIKETVCNLGYKVIQHQPDIIKDSNSNTGTNNRFNQVASIEVADHDRSQRVKDSGNTDYMSWTDVQARQTFNSVSDIAPPRTQDRLSTLASGRGSVNDLEGNAADVITLIDDGESQVLKFTFTIRLEKENHQALSGRNDGSSVVSGTINILKPEGTVSDEMGSNCRPTGNVRMSGSVASSGGHNSVLKSSEIRALLPTTNGCLLNEETTFARNDNQQGTRRDRSVEMNFDKMDISKYPANNIYSLSNVTSVCEPRNNSSTKEAPGSRSVAPSPQLRAPPIRVTNRDDGKASEFQRRRDSRSVSCSKRYNSLEHGSSRLCLDDRELSQYPSTENETNHQIKHSEGELTHMSWDEVMMEAKLLGIPLSRRTTSPDEPPAERRRRSSISSLTEHRPPTRSIFEKKFTVEGCSHCPTNSTNVSLVRHHPVGKEVKRTTSKDATSPDTRHSRTRTWGSPLRDKFQNLFGCRKQKVEDELPKQTVATAGSWQVEATTVNRQPTNERADCIDRNTNHSCRSVTLTTSRWVPDHDCLKKICTDNSHSGCCTGTSPRRTVVCSRDVRHRGIGTGSLARSVDKENCTYLPVKYNTLSGTISFLIMSGTTFFVSKCSFEFN